ncbi:MAG: hypothetical protein CBB97_07185 [Candidatus Endolissoclinum sp. TMED37]|nr:MAG: hypothetical protein CBB97_07185 [Candidatus Endolissoclinum sp. TMED37]
MPYRVRKQNCTRSDGTKGSYVLSYKPKKKTSKKKDSEGFVKAGCHTSKKKAHGQRAAIEGGPINAGHEKEQDTVLEWLLETIEELDEKEEVKSTKKYDDNKNLKGKQTELPDNLQKGIIKKADPDDPDLDESDAAHLRQYGAPQGSKRDKQLDQTKKDLASGDPEKVARAYRRRERMEKQERNKKGFKNTARKDTKKESVEITNLRNMIREILSEELSKKTKATLRKKAEERGFTAGSVEKEYKKGLAAWASSGSRKGMSQHQWAMARVNSANPSKSWAVVKKSKAKKKK